MVIVCLLVCIGMGSIAQGQCPVMEKLRHYYRQEKFIELNFMQVTHSDVFETIDTLTGRVWAGWKGRFRLEMPSQQLVSNGVLYWSYSVDNEQVIVDSVANLGGWNPLTLLYDPEGVYECHSQTHADGSYRFEMEAIDSTTAPRAFTLKTQERTFVPISIEYLDDNESRIEVFISDFRRVQAVADSVFEFVAPEGVEIIYMP